MKYWLHWFILLFVLAAFVFMTALFLTPDFTAYCTDQLFLCLEEHGSKDFWGRTWGHLSCVYQNTVCVLGGLIK